MQNQYYLTYILLHILLFSTTLTFNLIYCQTLPDTNWMLSSTRVANDVQFELYIKLMKGKAPTKHSLHEKTAVSVLLKLFISSNE